MQIVHSLYIKVYRVHTWYCWCKPPVWNPPREGV